MLWFALHFPLLPLEALCPRSPSPASGAAAAAAGAVVVARGRVVACDPSAAGAGVAVGQRLSAALGFAPGLNVCERHEGREKAALESLACWAGSFTPQVSLAPPATLLLEIGGCLRLFGGAPALVAAALSACREQGYTPTWAAAQTPQGATWLAWGAGGVICADRAALHAALAALPCSLPAWPAEVLARLHSFGLSRLGELRSLPRASLHRRLGSSVMEELARAWGEVPDPRPAFVFPESFAQGLELPARVDHAEALGFAAQRLFAALAGWLRGRHLALRSCRLLLTHDDGRRTALPLNLAEPTADEGRLARLLREHLSRLELVAPVEGLVLQADDVLAQPGRNGQLFAQPVAGEGHMACLERLRARLGEAAVHVLGQRPDYRPEAASEAREPGATARLLPAPGGPRPLWLLPVAQALPEQGGRPCWQGPLQLLTRPERLESGWWDDGEAGALGDTRRDYCVARNPEGRRLWIFRDSSGWFIHGFFA